MAYRIINGIDLVDASQMVFRVLEKDSEFFERFFTPAEISYCQKKSGHTNQALSFAVRLAAKGSVGKMLGLNYEMAGGKDIEVVNGCLGKPEIKLYGEAEKTALKFGLKADDVILSISHTANLAIASAAALINSKKEVKSKMGKVTVTSSGVVQKPKTFSNLLQGIAKAAGLSIKFEGGARDGYGGSTPDTAMFFTITKRKVSLVAICEGDEGGPIPPYIIVKFYDKHAKKYLDRFTKAAEAAVKNEKVDIDIQVV